MTGAEYECKFEPTKDTPYLALTGEITGVFCDHFGENRPRHNGTALSCVTDSVAWNFVNMSQGLSY